MTVIYKYAKIIDSGVVETKGVNERFFTAYATTFGNVDRENDIMDKEAFRLVLDDIHSGRARMPKLAYQHDLTKLCGIIRTINADDKGVRIEGTFIDTTLGRDTYEEVKTGAITDMSVGFLSEDTEFDPQNGTRTFKLIKELVEVSFVSYPANPQANVVDVKSLKTIREVEKFLRDAGMSQKEAKGLLSKGYAGLNRDDEASKKSENDDVLKALDKVIQSIK